MRLIDAYKLIMYVADCKLSESITWHEAELITDFILNSPTVESRPKGKWNHHKTKSNKNWYECDSCGWVHFQKSNYCPNCGADMRDERVLSCDRTKCHENEINDVPCEECECYSDTRGEEE